MQKAAAIASALGRELVDVRCTPVEALRGSENMKWADLVVTLSAEADSLCPPLLENNQKRNWFTDPRDVSDAALRERIKGMLGGIRLISRQDET